MELFKIHYISILPFGLISQIEELNQKVNEKINELVSDGFSVKLKGCPFYLDDNLVQTICALVPISERVTACNK